MSKKLIEEQTSLCLISDCSHQSESGFAAIATGAAIEDGCLSGGSAYQWKSKKQNEAFRNTISMHYRAMKKV